MVSIFTLTLPCLKTNLIIIIRNGVSLVLSDINAICFSITIKYPSKYDACLSQKCISTVTDSSHTPLILSISLKHLKMVVAQAKHFERHVLCYIRIATGYTCLFIYIFVPLSLPQFVFGLSLLPLSQFA